MAQAGKVLVGEHDFSSFRASGCQAHSPVREVREFTLKRAGCWIWFDITANAFLQHMVRNIAGSLIEVGCGKRELSWFTDVLQKKDRTQGGVTAPPNGLYLTGVEYASRYKLPTNTSKVAYWEG